MGIGKLSVECPYGQVGEIFEFGVNDLSMGVSGDLCMNTAENTACYPDNPSIPSELMKTIGAVNTALSFSTDQLWSDPSDFGSCTKPSNTLFIQYSCVMSES